MSLNLSRYKNDIIKLTKRLNSSFYFYDLDKLEKHLTYIRDHKDPSIGLYFACKANPLSAVLKLIRNLGIGVDVASIGELTQVISSGVKSSEIISTGPCKSKNYLRALIQHEIKCVVIESLNQLKWLNEIAAEEKIKVDVLLRVQLEWSEGKSVLGGNDITAFGLDEETWRDIDLNHYPHINALGFHVFQWGNMLCAKKLENIWDKTCAQVKALAQSMNLELKVIDLGGGLGIPYQDQDTRIDFKEVNQILVSLKEKFELDKIWMELGRFAVGECGYYLTQVIDKKITRGRNLLILDGGINHLARPALTNQGFPCERLNKAEITNSLQLQEFHIHGPLCTAIDKLGVYQLPSDIDCGDWMIFSQAGAYGFTEAMPFFLCHDMPAEVVAYKGDIMIPRTIKHSSDWLV